MSLSVELELNQEPKSLKELIELSRKYRGDKCKKPEAMFEHW